MKNYTNPEVNIELFSDVDVIATSSDIIESIAVLKTLIAGKEGEDYGTQSVSIYD